MGSLVSSFLLQWIDVLVRMLIYRGCRAVVIGK